MVELSFNSIVVKLTEFVVTGLIVAVVLVHAYQLLKVVGALGKREAVGQE